MLLIPVLLLPKAAMADCSPSNTGTEGPDQILCDTDNDPAGADVSALGGDDTLDLNGITTGTVDTGTGNDSVSIIEADIQVHMTTGDGDDVVTMRERLTSVGDYNGGGIDTGSGNDRVEVYDGVVFDLTMGAGNDEVLLDGGYIFNFLDMGDGDDNFHWDEGVLTLFQGGNGSDTVRIDAFAFEEEAILDGGDDLTADDGYVDSVRFVLDHQIDGRILQNWERVIVNGSSKLTLTGSLTVGGGSYRGERLGLDIRQGGVVDFVPKNYTVHGDLVNAGTLWLVDDRYNQLNITSHDNGRFGDYTGRGGRLWLDTKLAGDSAPTDLLTIAGDTRGLTFVQVFNRNGDGAATSDDGIKIIDVSGRSARDAFVLDGEYIGLDGRPVTVGGAYGYTLHHGGLEDPEDGNWYLRSTLPDPFDGSGLRIPRWQAGAVLYETYPQALRRMNQPTTLRKRVGNRFWAGTSHKDRGVCCYGNAVEKTIDGGGLWMRLTSEYNNNAPEQSTSRAEWQQDYGQVQVGADFSIDPALFYGRVVLGIFGQYAYGSTELDSYFGHGDIDTENFGIGSTLTWHGSQGSYVDLQAQFNWFDSDLYSHELWHLGTGNDAVAFNFSIEGGHSIKLCDYYSLTPQIQLAYTAEDIDDNFDQYGVTFTDAENEGGFARLGLAFEQRLSQRVNRNMYGNLLLERIGLYAIVNTFYYFDDETEVNISGTSLYQARDEWWGQVGVGATYDQCGDRCSVYGQVDYASSVDNSGDSDSVQFTIGFRFKW